MATSTIGFIAIASWLFMSLSPVPFIWRLLKNKDAEEFHPYPFIASSISHFLWFAYCINENYEENVTLTTSCLLFCSMVGLTFDLFYVTIIQLCTNGRRSLTFVCIFLTAGALLFFVFTPLCGNLSNPARKVFLGTLGVLSGTVMNLSPLSNINCVYKTKSSKYMPRIRCITMFLNSICWFTVSFIIGSFDPYIAITNGIGILSGFVILGILYKYRETSPKSRVHKRLETTLDVDPKKDIVVLNRICPRCDYIMFEKSERIQFLPCTKYFLYQNEESKRWRVNAVATTSEKIESYTGISGRFDKVSREYRNTLGPDQV